MLVELRERSLIDDGPDGTIALTSRGRDDYERLVAERKARLHELLAGWHPDQEQELQRLVGTLARDLVSAMPSPPAVSHA